MRLNEALVCFLVSCHTVNKCPFHSYLVLLFFGDAIQPSHPLSPLFLLPSVFPRIRVFSNESAVHIKWPKYWSFSFSMSPSSEYSGLISFRIDWFDLAVQFHSVMSNSLRPHGLQHTRPPYPSPTSRIYSNSCPLSWWCHPTLLSSVAPFSCPQSFPASGSFLMSHLLTSGGQSIEASASAWVLPVNIQSSCICVF